MSEVDQSPAGNRRKNWVIGIICLVVVTASLLSLARQMRPQNVGSAARGGPGGAGYPGGPGGRQMPGSRGKITAVSGSAITIQGRSGEAKTFTLTAATQITVDRKPMTAAELNVGQRARVVSPDSKNATEVHVFTRPFGGPGGGGGGLPGGDAPPAGGTP